MDLIRKKEQDNFYYFHKTKKKRVSDIKTLNRIKSLKIPPGYRNVIINNNANSHIQATGIDSANRKQYIYHNQFIQEQQEIKFSDLIHFGKKIKRIRSDVTNNISRIHNPLSKEKIISIIIFLIDKCHFRIGSKKYKELYNTHGISTINSNHLIFSKKHLRIQFVGKKGVVNVSKISNKEAIDYLHHLCSIHSNREFLFYYYDDKTNSKHHVTDKQVNAFLQKYHPNISAKFFRTWTANHTLLSELISYPKPKDIDVAKKNVSNSIKIVAQKLNNTPKVSKKNYINNEIFQLYLNDYKKFNQIIQLSRRRSGKLPSVDRLLTIFLQYLDKK